MSKLEKLIQKILSGKNVSYVDAEKMLEYLGFELNIRGSHHIFRKPGYARTVSIKKRPVLLEYQINHLLEVLKDHDY
jgi:predicted RNA binding protein YcfA (HicA-like mRNA interferase family)